jgi:hypothetical protein
MEYRKQGWQPLGNEEATSGMTGFNHDSRNDQEDRSRSTRRPTSLLNQHRTTKEEEPRPFAPVICLTLKAERTKFNTKKDKLDKKFLKRFYDTRAELSAKSCSCGRWAFEIKWGKESKECPDWIYPLVVYVLTDDGKMFVESTEGVQETH